MKTLTLGKRFGARAFWEISCIDRWANSPLLLESIQPKVRFGNKIGAAVAN
jgi:hypothetical protein